MVKKISSMLLLLVIYLGLFSIANASDYLHSAHKPDLQSGDNTLYSDSLKTTNQPNNQGVLAPGAPQPVIQQTPQNADTSKIETVEKLFKARALADEKYKKKQAEFVNALTGINYHTQDPPKKLYTRRPSPENRHLPAIYFKSYYLSLAFQAATKDDNKGLDAILLEHDFINGQNKDGDTILMAAIQSGSLNTARLLVAKGAYLDAVNHRNRTALHYAATLGELDFVKLLLSMGADYTLTDDKSMTAADYAVANGQYGVVDLINLYVNQ